MDRAHVTADRPSTGNTPWRERLLALIGGAMTMLTGARQRTALTRPAPRRGSRPDGVDQRRTVLIDRPRHEVYRVLRDLEVLPKFLDHITTVTAEDDQTWTFLVKDDEGELRWRARLAEDVPGNCLVWESLPGGDLIAGGSMTLSDGSRGGTVVDVEIWYRPPEDQPSDPAVQRLFARFGGRRLARNLLKLRAVIETDLLAHLDPLQSLDIGGLHANVVHAPRR
jgi:uncharacterized membrane protein